MANGRRRRTNVWRNFAVSLSGPERALTSRLPSLERGDVASVEVGNDWVSVVT
jgi:hypothetical protein